jgi:hypothetical protein
MNLIIIIKSIAIIKLIEKVLKLLKILFPNNNIFRISISINSDKNKKTLLNLYILFFLN